MTGDSRRGRRDNGLDAAAFVPLLDVALHAPERDPVLCQQVVDRCFASADYVEGRRAFMDKRPPRFQGR